MMNAQMARLQGAWQKSPGVAFVSFSVDPSHDTPTALAAYAQHFGASPDQWKFVTEAGPAAARPHPSSPSATVRWRIVGSGRLGAPAPRHPPESFGANSNSIRTVSRLAREGFHLSVAQEGSREEPITHSTRLVLIDQQAHIRGYYDATDAQALSNLSRDMHHLIRTLP